MMIDKKQLKTLLRSYGHNYYKAVEFYLSDKEKNGQRYKKLLDYNDERYIKWIEDILNKGKYEK